MEAASGFIQVVVFLVGTSELARLQEDGNTVANLKPFARRADQNLMAVISDNLERIPAVRASQESHCLCFVGPHLAPRARLRETPSAQNQHSRTTHPRQSWICNERNRRSGMGLEVEAISQNQDTYPAENTCACSNLLRPEFLVPHPV